MRIAIINSPSLTSRAVSRSMAGGLGFDGSDALLLAPLDLAIMAATLRNAGARVELIDADPLRLDAAAVHARLAGPAWDVLIASVSLPTLDEDAGFLLELKQRHPNARVFGKTMVRDHQVLRSLLERSRADLVIHGEADLSILDLIHDRSRAGSAWLEAGVDGKPVFRFDAGEPVADLNLLPLPARDLLPNAAYVYPLLGGSVATLQTSRGCPYPCGYYCPYPLVEGVKWRAQTPERIFAELKEVVEGLGITRIYFRDATFTLNQQRIARLCDLIIAAGWRLEWVCETRVDCLEEGLLVKMRASGCIGILIGVETGDEQVMHHQQGKKGLTVPKLSLVRRTTEDLGIRLHFLLIVGLPPETRESIVATYDLIQRYRPDTIGVTIITPYPGTPLYEEGLREGWIDSLQWRHYGGHQAPMHTPNLTREEMAAGKQFLEEGFAILQRRRIGGHSRPLKAMADQHYDRLLRWAYRLEEPVRRLRQMTEAAAPREPVAAHPAAHDPSAPAISVIMPTYNRRAILRKTLLAFASQSVPMDRFELVVVDDGSSDETVAMLGKFRAPYALRVFTQDHGGANAARNRGIAAARGEILLITGDDMVPGPAFLESHLKFHDQHPSEQDALLGFIDWSPELTVTPFMRFIVSPEGGHQFAFHEVKNGQADFRLFYTSNVSLKRRFLLRQETWFDADFTYPAYDDIELGYRLARQGMRLYYNPVAVTYHHHDLTLEGFMQRQRKAGQMGVVLARKHPELERGLLGLNETLKARADYEAEMRHLLPAALEAQKPDLKTLAGIRAAGVTFDTLYARTILYPLYGAILRAAYHAGVMEGIELFPARRAPVSRLAAPKQITVSIIIPVWNKVELTQQCLTKLAEVTHGVEFEVVIVDNGSTDETPAFLKMLGGDVQILTNPENLGFARACNQGAKAAKGEFLVFLNNDTIPLEGWLSALVEEAQAHPDVTVVGSKLLYEDGTIQHAGVAFSWLYGTPYHLYRGGRAQAAVVNRRREVQAVTAACMLVRREAFEAAGGFDEGYRNGFEDADLCLKIADRGGRIVYQPKSTLYHLESQTPGRKAHEKENAERLLKRWSHKWWLADEYALYAEDGMAYRMWKDNGVWRDSLKPFADAHEWAEWQWVGTAQRLAQRRDPAALAELKIVLAEIHAWPRDAQALRWGAHVCRHLGEPKLEEAFWRRLADLEDGPEAPTALARLNLDAGRLDEADRQIARLTHAHPLWGEGWLLRGVLAMQRQAFGEAVSAFETAVQCGADGRKARMGCGMAAIGEGRADRAWQAFLDILAKNPDDADALHWLLRAGTALERWDELKEQCLRFVKRNPGDTAVRLALAGVCLRSGDRSLARQEYDRLRLLDPAAEGLDELAKALDVTLCAAQPV